MFIRDISLDLERNSIDVKGTKYVPVDLVEQHFTAIRRSSVHWDIEDFVTAAQWEVKNDEDAAWKLVYDEDKFQQALERMIQDHDAEIGINWNTVSRYLNRYCKIEPLAD
jgi:hypothetical protein